MATQFLRNTRAVLDVTFSAGYADAADVQVMVVSEGGTVLATGQADEDEDVPGRYTFPVPPQLDLARIVLTWSGEWGGVGQSLETEAEIVGGLLFSIAEARGFNDDALSDESLYSDEVIREKRESVMDSFQNLCGVAFVPRYERETLNSNGRGYLWLPHKRPLRLLSLTVGGSPLGPSDLASVTVEPTGRLTSNLLGGASRQNVTVEWERGFRRVPARIKEAAMAYTRYLLVNSEVTDRMVTFANELGTVRLSTPGRYAPTGIPFVDAALCDYDERDILVAMA